MMLAEANNEFTGAWVFVAIAVVGGLGVILMIAAYFATSRELTTVTSSVDALTKTITESNQTNEQRAAEIHGRLNPVAELCAENKGKIAAFEMSFEKFTRVIESNSRTNNDTIRAFTESLQTFAKVLDQNSRRER